MPWAGGQTLNFELSHPRHIKRNLKIASLPARKPPTLAKKHRISRPSAGRWRKVGE